MIFLIQISFGYLDSSMHGSVVIYSVCCAINDFCLVECGENCSTHIGVFHMPL